jgi:hypothetical protein
MGGGVNTSDLQFSQDMIQLVVKFSPGVYALRWCPPSGSHYDMGILDILPGKRLEGYGAALNQNRRLRYLLSG